MKRTFLLFLFIVTAVLGIFSFFGDANIFNLLDLNRNAYKKALDLEEKGEYKNAYYAFKKVYSFYPAYDAVLYHQADCAAQIEDEKTAIKKYVTLIEKYPKSELLPEAYYKLGQAYLRTGQYTSSEKIFNELAEKYPGTDYKIATYYYLGILNKKKNPAYAISLWKEYLNLSPQGRFSIECVKELRKSNASLSNSDKINIGIAYYYAGQPSIAISNFEGLPIKKSWYYLALSYAKKGKKNEAIDTLNKGFTYYSKSFSQDKLQEMARLHVRLNPKKSLDCWQEVTQLTKNTPVHDYALYNLARVSPKVRAVEIYDYITGVYPNSDFASESLWELMWNAYKSGDFSKALHFAKLHRKKYQNAVATPKVIFWTGKIYEKQGNKNDAKKCYEDILENYNMSYYAFRANGRKKALRYSKDTLWGTKSSNRLGNVFYDIKIPVSGAEIKKVYGNSFWELLQVGDYKLAENYQLKDKALESWINYQKNLPTKSCLLARNIVDYAYPNPDLGDEVCKLAFPLHYIDEVNYFAKHYKIDSAIIMSILKEESCFNPNAVSGSNAYGLMQLLPTTAKYIADKKGIPYSERKSLFNPEINIKLGSAYIRYLYNDTGSMLYSVASYNAGPGAVQKWLKGKKSSDIDEFVEDIPYEETQNYVKKVYRSYWCYSRMY